MARRAKKQARRNGGGGLPGWAWLLLGLGGGAVIAAIVLLRGGWGGEGGLLPRPDPQARAPVTATEPEPEVAPEPRRPKFEFYDVLREREVRIPDAELNAPADPPTEAAAAAGGVRYLLQAGAFSSASDAEARKAMIALTGEVARVESAQIEGGMIHRVRLGPYPDRAALARAKAALEAHGLEVVAIKAE